MTRLALKSLWARKARALGTTFAVVIGIAFIAGSYVLTDTIFAAFDEIFSESLKGTSVVITAKNPVKQENEETPTFSASILPDVQRTKGVRLASGAIFTPGGFFDAEGNAIGAKFAPKFISSTLPDGLESLTYLEGHRPRGPTEASLDKAAAEDAGLKMGEKMRIVGQGSARSYRLVGFTQLGNASFGGASIAQVTLPVAQQITHKRGRFDQISVAAERGVSPEALKRRIEGFVPADVRVETAQENADRGSEEIRENLGFLQTFLLVFGFVAVFVGAFLIFNTFSITVAQRVTEFGMLRTLGASRRQILTSVLLEALAIGLLGALIGIAGGYLIAELLNALFEAFGIDLPTTGLVMETRTVIVSLLVGDRRHRGLLAGSGPALDPGAADRRPARRRRRRRAARRQAGLPRALGRCSASAASRWSWSASSAAPAAAAAACCSAAAPSRSSSPSRSSARGWCRRWRPSPAGRWSALRRLTGRLARENAQRNPSRTAVTAAALMIGLALVTFVTVFAAGLKSSVAQVVDENFAGGLVIQNTDGFSPIPNAAATAAREGAGRRIGRDDPLGRRRSCCRAGARRQITAPTHDIGDALEVEWKQGGPAVLRRLTDGAGGRLRLASPPTTASNSATASACSARPGPGRRFQVVGEFDSKLDLFGSVLITQPVLARDFGQTQDTIDFVQTAPGADQAAVQALLTRAVETAFPTAEVLNQQELKESREEQVNELLDLIYALLALAILISLFGIANTLALSIHERTRELGMLRAIGMSRRQVRTMIRYEAVITALIGAILGMVLGIVFAALIAQPLKDEGFTLSYPVGSLILLLVFAAILGVLAAIVPARRASRLDVLEALQYE